MKITDFIMCGMVLVLMKFPHNDLSQNQCLMKNKLPTIQVTEYPVVLLTHFNNIEEWEKLKNDLIKPYEDGFRANLSFIEDRSFESLQPDDFKNGVEGGYNYNFIFLADSLTFNSEDNSLICIDLSDSPGRFFRVIPSVMWGVENNLSISNMDYDDFFYSVDTLGIFRGF